MPLLCLSDLVEGQQLGCYVLEVAHNEAVVWLGAGPTVRGRCVRRARQPLSPTRT